MKNLKLIFLAVAFLALSSCTINRPQTKTKTVTVNGVADVLVSPDACELEFVVTTAGWSAKQIAADNNTITERFLTAVASVGVNQSDISRSECVVTNPASSYEARQTIKITVQNLSLVPAIIDCKTGLIKLTSSNYIYSDNATELRQVRTAAVKNAQDAASLLAGSSGNKLQDVIFIGDEKITQEKTHDGKIKIRCELTMSYDLI